MINRPKLPTLKPPGGGKGAGSKPAKGASNTLEMEEWGTEYDLFPSVLVVGPSGAGKTESIAQLVRAEFNVCLVPIEDKHASLMKYRNKLLRIGIPDPVGNRLPTVQEKLGRLKMFRDNLRKGMYRKHGDRTVDIIAVDGLMEVSEVIARAKMKSFSKSDAIPMWGEIAMETVDFFRDLRDAAGEGAARLGLNPVGILATCGEGDRKRVNMQGGGVTVEANSILLEGNKAGLALPFQFECVWRMSAGMSEAGEHEFRIQTVPVDNLFAKGPTGVFDKFVRGPGGVGNAPDVGVMYRQLLTHPNSPYSKE